jgi:hypothetical protein
MGPPQGRNHKRPKTQIIRASRGIRTHDTKFDRYNTVHHLDSAVRMTGVSFHFVRYIMLMLPRSSLKF